FFIIAVQTPGSGISILLAVGTPSTGSGNLYCQWELSPSSGSALNSILKTQKVNNVETIIPPTTADEKLQRRNEVKARSTLMMGLPNEHQLKFNSFKDAKSLLAAIEKSTNTQNVAFVSSSSNNSNSSNGVNTAHGINTANGVNTVISQEMAMLTMQARRFLKNTGRKLNMTGNDFVAFDKTKVECYNCHKRCHLARECQAPRGHDNKSRDVTRKTVPVETPNSSALNASKTLNKIIKCQIVDNCKNGLRYNVIPPPHTGLFPPLKSNLSSTGLEELFNEPKTKKSKDRSNKVELESIRKHSDAPIIEDWVSDDEEEEVKKQEVKPSINRINFVKATTNNNLKETIQNDEQPKQNTHRKRDYEKIDGGYVAFGGNPKGGKITCRGTKDETSGTLKSFITRVENVINLRGKVIICDNGTKFKNREMNQFCEVKGIMRQYSVARTPQQNGVAERRNRTLIEAARTMLADLKLPTTFWAEIVNIACYVQNRVLVTKPHNKTPYELFHGRPPAISFLRPFGFPVTILNTIDHLGKLDGKADEGFFVRYSLNSKVFRVFNSGTRIMEENLHVRFSENSPNHVGTKESNDAGKEKEPGKDYILLPLWTADSLISTTSKSSQDNEFQPLNDGAKRVDKDLSKENECNAQGEEDTTNNTNRVNNVTSNFNAASSSGVNVVGTNMSIDLPPDLNMPSLEDVGIFEDSHDDEDMFGAEADFHNLDSAFQTRRMSKNLKKHGLVGTVIPRTDNKDFQNCSFACFLSQMEPKNVLQALKDPSWIETMKEELLHVTPPNWVEVEYRVRDVLLHRSITQDVY
nr:putative ribonuclease H-like domain-containing protein [Tanacetum cinerariifolium]